MYCTMIEMRRFDGSGALFKLLQTLIRKAPHFGDLIGTQPDCCINRHAVFVRSADGSQLL
jgi:hypothetical protein